MSQGAIWSQFNTRPKRFPCILAEDVKKVFPYMLRGENHPYHIYVNMWIFVRKPILSHQGRRRFIKSCIWVFFWLHGKMLAGWSLRGFDRSDSDTDSARCNETERTNGVSEPASWWPGLEKGPTVDATHIRVSIIIPVRAAQCGGIIPARGPGLRFFLLTVSSYFY